MSKEKVPDGRIDMNYVIYRLEEIEGEDVSDYTKVTNLKFFISELLAKLSQDGQELGGRRSDFP